MKAKTLIQSAVVAVIAVITSSVQAAPPPGQLLASMCFQCHGTNGQAINFESIAGKSAREIYKELLEMSKRKKPEGIMDLQARAYTPNQILLISNYLATLPKAVKSGSGSKGGDDD